jgi:hypothetical protein
MPVRSRKKMDTIVPLIDIEILGLESGDRSLPSKE